MVEMAWPILSVICADLQKELSPLLLVTISTADLNSKKFLSRAGLCLVLHLLLAAVAKVPVSGTNRVSNGQG